MSKKRTEKKHYGRRSWSRTLLLAVFGVAAVYAGVHCWLRAPDLKPQEDLLPVDNTDAQSAAEEAAAKAEALAQAAHAERKPNCYTILVSGVDDGNGGSDTNILLSVDAEAGRIHGVSIPRDSKAVVNGKDHKINFAYNHGGIDLMAQTVSQQLGIPVDFTVSVDLDGFKALVNAIDGVDFTVPIDMNYDDPKQDLSIHFTKGPQHLNGQQALEVVRFRENNDGTGYGTQDLGRMATQQSFLKAVAKQTLTLANVDKVGEFAKIFQKYVETDLTLGNMAWLGGEAIQMGVDSITFSTLPGEWKSPYIYLDREAVLTLVNESLNPFVEARVAGDLQIPT
ncbi:MAG: LCP family protein [Oscillibacter sp.]